MKKVKHYVYITYAPRTGDFYIGCRTCPDDIAISNDKYVGSGAWIKKVVANREVLRKEILKSFLNDLTGARRLERLIIEKIGWLERCKNVYWKPFRQLTCECGKDGFFPYDPSTHYPKGIDVQKTLYLEPFSLAAMDIHRWPPVPEEPRPPAWAI